MKPKPTLTLDALRAVAPITARAVSGVSTYEDHLQAMRELEALNRQDMVNAFWAYLSGHAGYAADQSALLRLTEQERAQFDKAIVAIKSRK